MHNYCQSSGVCLCPTQFKNIFGIPKVKQSNQGSNFSSNLLEQVLKQLHDTHSRSSAYRAQSQGALERFHQATKSLLRAYFVQLGADWEEGWTGTHQV